METWETFTMSRKEVSRAGLVKAAALKRSGQAPCAHVLELVHVKLEDIERAMTDLTRVRGQLRRLLQSWRAGRHRPAAVCPCIEHLKVVKGRR
jgi:hypothetical protein